MHLDHALANREKVLEFQSRHRIGLLTLLFTDLVGSTKLKQSLGDHRAVALIQQHHALVRELLSTFKEGEEIDTAGDSFFLVFAKPSDGVRFSLLLHSRLRALADVTNVPLLDRIGLHIGEVIIEEREGSAKPRDLYGLQVDICARVMSLADGDQIVMTRAAFDSARQVLKGRDLDGIGDLSWLNHGPYVFKGVDEPMEVCEVGETGKAQLKRPSDSEKAHRHVSPDSEPVLGWRPAIGQVVPNTRWVLEKQLGEGGFGEVWLGRHQHTKERRVFKFCFQAERVRSLKREMTLFRLLKERIGDHPNIVRLNDFMLDQPPFYVEMDYVEGADLRSWCAKHGGINAIPLETRLEMVAQAADGLQAAHEAGIIHRDIKPGNILIGSPKSDVRSPNSIQVKLTDFGIGQVVSEEYLSGITRAGFTLTMAGDASSSGAGTQMYMAPELLAGKPASTRSDVYSLGVVLYQLLVGDFTRPLTTDWTDHIADPPLRDDLKHCFAGDPNERFGSAADLAKNLRLLPERRAVLQRQQAEFAAREKAAYRRGIVRTASLAAVIVVLLAGLSVIALHQSRKAQRGEIEARHLLYVANMNMAQQAWEENNMRRFRQLLEETQASPDKGFEWYYWQRQTHLALMTLRGHTDGISSVAFSPDGWRIVTGSNSGDQTAKVWEAASGRDLLTLKGHSNGVCSVAFSPDGKRIVTGSWDKTAKVWESATGKGLLTLKGHSNGVCSVAFSPDGQRIVTGGYDQAARVWEAATGKELLTLKGHSNRFVFVAFSPDGRRIVTGSEDKTAKVWEAATGKELLMLQGHGAPIWSVAFSLDGQRIVTGSADRTAKVWEATTGKELLTLTGHSDVIGFVAFSTNGQQIVTGSVDGTAKRWQATTGQELLTLTFKGHSASIWSVALSPDGQRIVTGSGDGTAKVWEAASNRGLLTLKGHSDQIRSVAFSPDGQRIVTGSWDKTAMVWEAATGKELLTLTGHTNYVRSVAFSPDGKRIVTGSADQTAKVWTAATGKELLTLKGHTSLINSVAYSSDGQRIVTGSGDGTVRVFEAATSKELLTLKKHAYRIYSVAFSPDGKQIATCVQGETVKIWEAATGKELLRLKGYSGGFGSVAFSPEGKRIVTANGDGTAKVWEAASGRELLTLKGHSGFTTCAVFSPDGQRVVTGSSDKTAKIWEVVTGRELLTLKAHSDEISSLAFSPDGRRIVTGSADQTAKVWTAATPQQVAAWQDEERAAVRPP